jgi:16S rRNA (guanine966-N2)-methyltransferase
MRITGGTLRGRVINPPRQGVRPSQDRVREALFSMLADRIRGARFLDLFAGSGAVGLEAWSRGAAAVCWVERDPRALLVLRATVSALCGSNEGVVGMDVPLFLKRRLAGGAFDVIFADPPYGPSGPAAGKGAARMPRRQSGAPAAWGVRLLAALAASPLLQPDGVFVMEQSAREALGAHPAWRVLADRRYGDSRLSLYRRVTAGE